MIYNFLNCILTLNNYKKVAKRELLDQIYFSIFSVSLSLIFLDFKLGVKWFKVKLIFYHTLYLLLRTVSNI